MCKTIKISFLLGFFCMQKAGCVCPSNCIANTDCDSEPDNGCPRCMEAYYGRQCQYRMECRHTTKGEEYRGLLNTTKSGYTCQAWTSQSPHNHGSNGINSEGNYCRSPIEDLEPTVWCYTTNPNRRWEACEIPLCSTQCTAPPQNPKARLITPAKPGQGFYDGYTALFNCPGSIRVTSVCNSKIWSNSECHGPKFSGQNLSILFNFGYP